MTTSERLDACEERQNEVGLALGRIEKQLGLLGHIGWGVDEIENKVELLVAKMQEKQRKKEAKKGKRR